MENMKYFVTYLQSKKDKNTNTTIIGPRGYAWHNSYCKNPWNMEGQQAYFWPTVNKGVTQPLFDLIQWDFFWPEGKQIEKYEIF